MSKNVKNCKKLSKLSKKNCQNVGQVMFPHHSDQMSQELSTPQAGKQKVPGFRKFEAPQ